MVCHKSLVACIHNASGALHPCQSSMPSVILSKMAAIDISLELALISAVIPRRQEKKEFGLILIYPFNDQGVYICPIFGIIIWCVTVLKNCWHNHKEDNNLPLVLFYNFKISAKYKFGEHFKNWILEWQHLASQNNINVKELKNTAESHSTCVVSQQLQFHYEKFQNL